MRAMRRQRRLLRAAASQHGLTQRVDHGQTRQFARKPDPLAPPPPPSSFAPLSGPSEHFRFELLHASAKAGSRSPVRGAIKLRTR